MIWRWCRPEIKFPRSCYHSLQLLVVYLYHINFYTFKTIFICRECCRNFNYVSPLLWTLMQSHLILILKFSTEKLFLNEFRDFGFNTGRSVEGGGERGEMENILIDFYFVEVKTRRQTMLQWRSQYYLKGKVCSKVGSRPLIIIQRY